jgi:uncharacterized protein (DUF2062 family)
VSPAAAPTASFWQRRVVAPLLAQLTQGTSPDRLAATLALGTACSLFPFLGFTALLNLAVGTALRLNQPILQILNQLLGPVQLVLILLYVRLGEWFWGASASVLSVSDIVQTFRDASLGEFFRRFGWAGIHAFTAWIATAPLLIALVYFALRPVMQKLASKRPARP